MFYKWVKRVLLLSVTITLVFALGLGLGWMGLQKTVFALQLGLITTGLFVFYQTRRQKVKQAWIKAPALAAHIFSLPVALFMALALGNETWAQQYWFVVNLVMIIALGITWLLLLLGLPLPALARGVLVLVSGIYLVLLCLHMGGAFNNGKIIFFSGLLIFPGTIVLIFLGIKKPQPGPPAAE